MSRTFKEKLLESGIGDYAAELINDPGSHGSNIVTAEVNNLTGRISLPDEFGIPVFVTQFGAKGDGVTDDTIAIEKAHVSYKNVIYPAGTFIYNGNGMDIAGNFKLEGDGRDVTTIKIASGKRFIAATNPFGSMEVSGITFDGGAGAILNTFSGGNVSSRKIISGNRFVGYTACAIDLNHNDNPYYDIHGNEFTGFDSIATIGIALGRNSDCSVISSNAFTRNKVHIKLRDSGVVTIENNDFIQSDAGTNRAFIWLTGSGKESMYAIGNNKFGNENQATTDYRVCVVPQLVGASNGTSLPDFTTLAVAGEYSPVIDNNWIHGANGGGPVIYTVSQEMRGVAITNNRFRGSPPSCLIHYGMAVFKDNRYERVLTHGNAGESMITVATIPVTNLGFYGGGVVGGLDECDPTTPSVAGVNAGRVGFVELLSTRTNSFNLVSATKSAAITDATGGSDATEFTVTNNCEIYANLAAQPIRGEVAWVEVDLAPGASSPVSLIDVCLFSISSGSELYWLRRLKVPSSGWRSFRFPCSVVGVQDSRFKFIGVGAGSVKVGRVRMYQSRAPILSGITCVEQLKVMEIGNYANDAAAASGGIPIGAIYHSSGAVKVRLI